MPSNKDDLFGGFFDLNGDGKTSIDEEFVAFQMLHDDEKNEDNLFSTPKPSNKTNGVMYQKQSQTVSPDLPPKERYIKAKSIFNSNIFSAIATSIIVLFPVIAVNWAAISTYDEKNSASGFLIAVFLIAGIAIIGCLWKAVIPGISDAYQQLVETKNTYLDTVTDAERKAYRKRKIRNTAIGWLGAVSVFVLMIILLSSTVEKSDTSRDSYQSKYGTNNYSSSKYSGNGNYYLTRPAVNKTPAMTKEEAERLSGTGYHGCRPHSSAENLELKAAQIKCKNCGYHSDNGANSYCDYCQWMLTHEGKLPSNGNTISSNTPTNKNNRGKSNFKNFEDDDKYNVNNYSNEEDFYYDHYDDFFDYEDAEKYYKEHRK